MKKFMLVTRLDMDKYEGQSSFNLAWVKEFILEQNSKSFITPQKERIAQPQLWFFVIEGNMNNPSYSSRCQAKNFSHYHVWERTTLMVEQYAPFEKLWTISDFALKWIPSLKPS